MLRNPVIQPEMYDRAEPSPPPLHDPALKRAKVNRHTVLKAGLGKAPRHELVVDRVAHQRHRSQAAALRVIRGPVVHERLRARRAPPDRRRLPLTIGQRLHQPRQVAEQYCGDATLLSHRLENAAIAQRASHGSRTLPRSSSDICCANLAHRGPRAK
ncbi:hypothetical protein MY4824_007692 [Beauveria thailandica]